MLTHTRPAVSLLIGILIVALFASVPALRPAVAAEADPPAESGPRILAATAEAPLVQKASKALSRDELLVLAARDPMAIGRLGLERCEREVRDYLCTFQKQERIGEMLKPTEEIEVRFRQHPVSVFMFWKKPDQVKRALYVDRKDFVNDDGEKFARVEPGGAIIRLLVSDVEMPIHGERAREASRRTIDEFGFHSMLRMLDRYNAAAADAGVLKYVFKGESQVDGRPTLVFERHLPYSGPGGKWPDAKMVLHIDQEWLIPTSLQSYADHQGKRLLGSYVYSRIQLNAGLTDRDFQF